MNLEKYSIGIGDRFGRQGAAQLEALQRAQAESVAITSVWNKSNREHQIIGTKPADTRRAADQAVRARKWSGSYYVDADHIGLKNVGAFLDACDFFTLDVAESIGQTPDPTDLAAFIEAQRRFVGRLNIPGLDGDMEVTAAKLEQEKVGNQQDKRFRFIHGRILAEHHRPQVHPFQKAMDDGENSE